MFLTNPNNYIMEGEHASAAEHSFEELIKRLKILVLNVKRITIVR